MKPALLLLLLFTTTVSARTVDLEGRVVETVVPSGYCELETSPPELQIRAVQKRFNAQKNRVVSLFGLCSELKELRDGRRSELDSFGSITTPLKDLNLLDAKGMTRKYFIDFALGAKGRESRERGMESVTRKLQEFAPGSSSPQNFGVIDSDASAVYYGTVLTGVLDSGAVGTSAIVSGQTIVRDRMFTVSLRKTFPSDPDMRSLLVVQKENLANFVRVNEK